MKILILAGGFATRLWPLTEKTAKPLLRIGGKEILSYLLSHLPPDAEIVISTNRIFADDFTRWIAKFPDYRLEMFIEDAIGEKTKKGALAAVSLVIQEKKWTDDFFVFAGDNLFLGNMQPFFQSVSKNPHLMVFDLQDRQEAKKFGVVVEKDGVVSAFQEKPDHPESSLISTGALFFPAHTLPEIQRFAEMEKDNLGGVFEHFLRHDISVSSTRFTGDWFDIGSFPAFLEAQRLVLGSGFWSKEAEVGGTNEYAGFVFLEPGATIENVVLEDVIIESGARIKNATIRHTVIGKNARIEQVDISGVALREESVVSGRDLFFGGK